MAALSLRPAGLIGPLHVSLLSAAPLAWMRPRVAPRRVQEEPIPVDRDKVGRLYIQEAKFELGLVQFPKGASFLPELEAELLAFPNGKTDDQVDSISQALASTGYTFNYDNVS